MKTLNRHGALLLLVMFAFTPLAHGQLLKKLGKRAERAAERTVERQGGAGNNEKNRCGLGQYIGTGIQRAER